MTDPVAIVAELERCVESAIRHEKFMTQTSRDCVEWAHFADRGSLAILALGATEQRRIAERRLAKVRHIAARAAAERTPDA